MRRATRLPIGKRSSRRGGNAPGLAELEAEGWIVAWGTHFRNAKQGTSQFVLAHSPAGLESDSYVLYLDGAVSRIPPDELKAKLADQAAPAATP
jgi:hypothetical protein